MAPAVMPGGNVWAVDVQPEMFSLLQAVAKRSGLTQIERRLGAVDDVRLAAGTATWPSWSTSIASLPSRIR
jgi:hypothetical protein